MEPNTTAIVLCDNARAAYTNRLRTLICDVLDIQNEMASDDMEAGNPITGAHDRARLRIIKELKGKSK